jgi:hypothetical protein
MAGVCEAGEFRANGKCQFYEALSEILAVLHGVAGKAEAGFSE